MQTKLESLLRFHRAHCFDAQSGDAHARAIRRLKRTTTARAAAKAREDRETHRKSERYLSMYA